MAENQPSTLKSYIDSATGKAQEALGNLTGNTGDRAKGELREENARAEHDASHATAKVPGGAISGSGAAVRDDPNRTEGTWNQTVGSTKEAVGNLTGNEVFSPWLWMRRSELVANTIAKSLKQAGREQNLEGQSQEAKGQLKDFGSGAADRAQGALGSAVSGLTGDRAEQVRYDQLRAEGKTQQRSAEHDIQKQAEAERRH
ncbi:hypothetical protein ACRE_039680 [Hapsidospora chrysogenum ATCC 11550]|uniref:CsbD-like domain-containing protein n=1 Tax=Hapsidospora chrysogenum (strain ATCC 11550 / CBS 779.69 / DSM 880 / IAM 14645 / JCM 23072 / IMI 49137) TaxID=857340 RepID=A0A086T7C3_HAPC1|nr:hypothetical protein ACRE_039680 [Hapsidospora chrysogenum ATCC 11550]